MCLSPACIAPSGSPLHQVYHPSSSAEGILSALLGLPGSTFYTLCCERGGQSRATLRRRYSMPCLIPRRRRNAHTSHFAHICSNDIYKDRFSLHPYTFTPHHEVYLRRQANPRYVHHRTSSNPFVVSSFSTVGGQWPYTLMP
jgi:hypothetical protein